MAVGDLVLVDGGRLVVGGLRGRGGLVPEGRGYGLQECILIDKTVCTVGLVNIFLRVLLDCLGCGFQGIRAVTQIELPINSTQNLLYK